MNQRGTVLFRQCCLLLLLPLAGLALRAAPARATPDCYTSASAPAHDFVFLPRDAPVEVTSLTPDGERCVRVTLYNGEPLLRQKLYAPFRKVYEAYARAVESGDARAAQRLYAYLRPTPRPFPLWLWLANAPEGAPMPWGTDMALKLLRILRTYPGMERQVRVNGNEEPPVLDMRRAWPLLFLLMGGEVRPQGTEDWTPSALSHRQLNELLLWRYPWAVIESMRGKNRETQVRLR